MRGWQRNRLVLAGAIIIGAIVAIVPGLTLGQRGSLAALLALIFFLYVRYLNRY